MKPLTLEETKLKEEMKERCIAKGQYKDKNAKAKFNMLCHLEDFEIQYWELQKENKQLKENAENNDKVVDNVNWENQLLKKENQKLKEQNKKEFADYIKFKKEQYDEYLEKVNKLIKEKQELKKQLEEYKDKINWYENFEVNKTIDKLRLKHNTQQKEFINYLEKEIKRINSNELDIGELNLRLDDVKFTQYLIYKEILQKYESIIGVSDENNMGK